MGYYRFQRLIEGLNWDERKALRQAAQSRDGKIRRWETTQRGVAGLVRRSLLTLERVTPKGTAIYRITEAGRQLAGRLPSAEEDSPLLPENQEWIEDDSPGGVL